MKALITLILIAAGAYAASASAQKDSQHEAHTPASSSASTRAASAASSTSACPSGLEMTHQHLQGVWRAQLDGTATGALLRLGPHPELGESVRGTVQRGSATAQASGDVHEGELTLEESTDGQHISATWLGTVVEGSCAREIRGTWHHAATDTTTPFVLRRQTGWH